MDFDSRAGAVHSRFQCPAELGAKPHRFGSKKLTGFRLEGRGVDGRASSYVNDPARAALVRRLCYQG